MFNIGPAELMVVLLVALLVLGPNKLPDAARQVGRAIGELRKLSSGFQAEMRDALKEPVEGKPTPSRPAAIAAAVSDVKADGAKPDGALSSPRPPAGDAEITTAANGTSPGTEGPTTEEATAEEPTAAIGDAAVVDDPAASGDPAAIGDAAASGDPAAIGDAAVVGDPAAIGDDGVIDAGAGRSPLAVEPGAHGTSAD